MNDKYHVVLEKSGLQRGHALQGTGRFIRMLEDALRSNQQVDLRILAQGDCQPRPDITYRSRERFYRTRELLDIAPRTMAWRRGSRADEVLVQPSPYFQVLDPRRSVVGILDVIPLDLKGSYARTGIKAKIVHRLASQASSIITLSEFSKSRIVQTLGVDEARITVTPLYSQLTEPAGRAVAEVDPPYLLSVCDMRFVDRRKRLDWLIEISKRVARPRGVRMVFAGAEGSYSNLLRLQADDAGVIQSTIFPGRVSDRVLASLYQHCEAVLFPSEYEGFGLPCVEAFAYGCPVVVTRTTCLPEVVGVEDFVSDDSLAAFCDRVAWILDSAPRSDLRRQARERSLQFTADGFANGVMAALSKAKA